MHTSTAKAAHEMTASGHEHPGAAKYPGTASSLSGLQSPSEPLSSWKEIAVYLHRQVRTVQRWEKHEGLPIHRHRHRRGNSVYAYKAELDGWWSRETRSVEDQLALLPSKDASPQAAGSQAVNALDAKVECQEQDPTSDEWFVECVLELRTTSPGSSGYGTGPFVSALRVRIPVRAYLGPWERGRTTRDAKVSCRSLSLVTSQPAALLCPLRRRTRGTHFLEQTQ